MNKNTPPPSAGSTWLIAWAVTVALFSFLYFLPAGGAPHGTSPGEFLMILSVLAVGSAAATPIPFILVSVLRYYGWEQKTGQSLAQYESMESPYFDGPTPF